jgi:hypothetical protein
MCSLPTPPPTKSQLTYNITILIFSHIKRLWDCPKNNKNTYKNTDKNTNKKNFNYDDMWGQFEPLD